jgi:hypothetical protein
MVDVQWCDCIVFWNPDAGFCILTYYIPYSNTVNYEVLFTVGSRLMSRQRLRYLGSGFRYSWSPKCNTTDFGYSRQHFVDFGF